MARGGGGRTESGEGRIGAAAGELLLPGIVRSLGESFFCSALQIQRQHRITKGNFKRRIMICRSSCSNNKDLKLLHTRCNTAHHLICLVSPDHLQQQRQHAASPYKDTLISS